mmetsp:Transcript_97074/g.302183  ORF Transcript_97074/g.302183 Transcript_97074/m.302183 type:complete len:264 (+) Transcript_97074:99-890(+)|eukprot:CAMPEP_0204589984 /NCGR_PEP_ID=MMETSP0661-20131031/49527_1 /ASSEMBLY_ACC=CAM_ASM_000606 /TAXON_ID=109239 /ORGANISM="Alexandrium margalefi, Strain AMGDE01CS-322" /LENGTH=263 /DNA_ID=CAMNT_0051599969 /DNA_START=64 /DNA_END=855 /DNA_ORIENTATION=-
MAQSTVFHVFHIAVALLPGLLLTSIPGLEPAGSIPAGSARDIGGRGGPNQTQDPLADCKDQSDELPKLRVGEALVVVPIEQAHAEVMAAPAGPAPTQAASATEGGRRSWLRWVRSSRVAKTALLALATSLLCCRVAGLATQQFEEAAEQQQQQQRRRLREQHGDLAPDEQGRLLALKRWAELEASIGPECKALQEECFWSAKRGSEGLPETEHRELEAARAGEGAAMRARDEYEGAAEAACDGLLDISCMQSAAEGATAPQQR